MNDLADPRSATQRAARVRAALDGVSGIHVSPFNAAGALDEAAVERNVNSLVDAGIDNNVSGGNMGEFYSLDMREIETFYRRAITCAAGRAVVTGSVGRSCHDASRLAEIVAKAGADAIMIHQPPDPFVSARGIIAYVHAIADEAALPCVLYVRNDRFSAGEFDTLVGHPQVTGVKYAVPDLPRATDRARICARCDVAFVRGLAEPWAIAFTAIGARGFTSGLVNVFPQRSLAVRDVLARGDYPEARRLVDEIAEFETLRAMQNNGCNVTVVKTAMRLLGFDVGAVRPPGTPRLDDEVAARLAGVLHRWGLLGDLEGGLALCREQKAAGAV